MEGLARKTDPATSKQAAFEFHSNGHLWNTVEEARFLVKEYPGRTFQELFALHVELCKRSNLKQQFSDPPSLMRRLSGVNGVARKEGKKICPVTGRPASKWFVR